MQILSPSVSRVQRNTAEHVNRRIMNDTVNRIRGFAAGGPEAIDRRLRELDQEWDIERVIETVGPVGILLGLTLGLTRNKRFFAIPAAIASVLIVHGVQGWLPPLPILRRLGLRTPEEIDEERYALRALRGDFDKLPKDPARVFSIVRHQQNSGQAFDSADRASERDAYPDIDADSMETAEPTPGSAEGDRETIEADLADQDKQALEGSIREGDVGAPNLDAGPISKEAFDAQQLENRIRGG